MDPERESRQNLTESFTVPSDSELYSANNGSEAYSANNELSTTTSPSSPSSSPLILYSRPTFWSILRGAAINVLLPFINGLMLGFGELLAHEAAFRLGWGGTKVFPSHRNSRPVGPGIEVREDPSRRRRPDQRLEDMTSLE